MIQIEMTPEVLVRELVATEIHRRRLLTKLEASVGRPICDPGVFQYSHLIIGTCKKAEGFGEGFDLTEENIRVLLTAAFERAQ